MILSYLQDTLKDKRDRLGNHYSKNFKLAYPVMISQLGHTIVALSDSVIMGRKGAISLAAVSLANAAYALLLIIGIGIAYGLTPLIAQNSAKNTDQNNIQKCSDLLKNSLLVNILTGLLLLMMSLGMVHFLDKLGQSPEVVIQSKVFLVFLAFSTLPLMVFLGFKQFAEGLGFTKQAMMISIAGNIFNILLGVTLVFGLFGIKPMGIMGIGISTFTDRLLMAMAMSVFVLGSYHFKEFQDSLKNSRFSWPLVKNLLGIGIPVALQYIFEVSAFAGAAIMIGWINPTSLAAHQIAISLASITYMMASGISAAATIHSGQHYGSSNYQQLRDSSVGSFHMVVFFMLICAFLFFSLRNILPLLYIKDQAVISSASSLILVAGFFQLFDGVQVVGLGVLRGMSDVKIPTLITLVSYWGIGLPAGYLLNLYFHLGAIGIWIGLSLGLMAASILIVLRFNNKIKSFGFRKD